MSVQANVLSMSVQANVLSMSVHASTLTITLCPGLSLQQQPGCSGASKLHAVNECQAVLHIVGHGESTAVFVAGRSHSPGAHRHRKVHLRDSDSAAATPEPAQSHSPNLSPFSNHVEHHLSGSGPATRTQVSDSNNFEDANEMDDEMYYVA